MFNKKKKWYDDNYFMDWDSFKTWLYQTIKSETLCKANLSDFIECEKCGCLLNKLDKFKRESTIEKTEIIIYHYNYPINTNAGGYGYTHVQYASTPVKTGNFKEVLKEHYICNRCYKPKTKKEN